MSTRTAICLDNNGDYHPIHCAIHVRDDGVKCLKTTQKLIEEEHPGFRFVSWAFDLNDSSHRNTINLYFLSPNVRFKKLWVMEDSGIIERAVYREEV